MKKQTKSSDWAKLLSESLSCREHVPPGDGWLSRGEVSKLIKLGNNATYTFLSEGIKLGTIEIFKGTVLTPSNMLVKSIKYRIKTK